MSSKYSKKKTDILVGLEVNGIEDMLWSSVIQKTSANGFEASPNIPNHPGVHLLSCLGHAIRLIQDDHLTPGTLITWWNWKPPTSKIRRWSATFLYQNHSGRDEKQSSEMFRNSKTPWDCNMMASEDILSSNMEQLSTGYTNSAETWDWHLQAPSSGSSWSQKRPWRQW